MAITIELSKADAPIISAIMEAKSMTKEEARAWFVSTGVSRVKALINYEESKKSGRKPSKKTQEKVSAKASSKTAAKTKAKAAPAKAEKAAPAKAKAKSAKATEKASTKLLQDNGKKAKPAKAKKAAVDDSLDDLGFDA